MKITHMLRGALLAALVFGIHSNGHAQSNLVNFYTWTMEFTPPTNLYTAPRFSVVSSNNADFFDGNTYTQNSPFVTYFEQEDATFVGTLNTIPGATYQISYTVQNEDSQYAAYPSLFFGNFQTNYSFWPEGNQFSSFTAVATSPFTTMSFDPNSMNVYAEGDVRLQNVVILPLSVPPYITQMTPNADGSKTLSLAGMPTNSYVLQMTTNPLSPAGWTPLATNTLSANYSWQFTDCPATNSPTRFYRLEQLTP